MHALMQKFAKIFTIMLSFKLIKLINVIADLIQFKNFNFTRTNCDIVAVLFVSQYEL